MPTPEKPKLPVEHRSSAGGVLVRRTQDTLEVCLIKPQGGKPRWQLPKGIIDQGERAPAAAVREVLEETGHRGRLVGDKLGDVEYWYVDKWRPAPVRVHKKVTWFVLELEQENAGVPDPVETAEVKWLSFDEALAAIEFKPERGVVDKARARLSTSPAS